ncbi:hypothetical protein, partial [Salmonella enterica]|uniref:hypothetical protein n=1 Tax=Salmonella enterica TaxID=28901 RepID=UPI003CF058FD
GNMQSATPGFTVDVVGQVQNCPLGLSDKKLILNNALDKFDKLNRVPSRSIALIFVSFKNRQAE